ncbi:hypothetical protein DL96DRAFT_648185 [Flagelloscypha sp. PMI_526]|nr:hypothetical protein DL96DRAFT_648185 [Flagelloscypha sp. PMI_526]
MDTRSRRKAREAVAEFDRTLGRKCVHNSSTSIARLPNDVLSAIFLSHKHAIMRAYQRGQSYGYTTSGITPWISPSHVCTLWRIVALNCAPFWSTLLLRSPSATRELLRRSKQSPLHVGDSRNVVNSEVALVECLSLALKESHRIETLDLFCVTRVLQSWGWQKVAESMPAAFEGVDFPILRQVTLFGDKNAHIWNGYAAVGLPLLLEFLKRPLGCLKDLRMKICPVAFWQALPPVTANGITELTLSIRLPNFVPHLLSFLRALPNLQSLDIEDEWAWYDRSDAELQLDTLFSPFLPSLHSLALTIRPQYLKPLLESIQLPNQLSHCKLRPSPLSAKINVEYALIRLLPLQPETKSATIELTGGPSSVSIQLSTYGESTAIGCQLFTFPLKALDPYPTTDPRSSHLPQIDISWHCSKDVVDSFAGFADERVLTHVEALLQHVEVISLRLRTREDNNLSLLDSWISMIGRLPCLRRLDIWRSGVRDQRALLRFLSTPPSLPRRNAVTKLHHFKSLEEVNFERAAFFHGTPITDTENVPPSPPSTVKDRRTSHDQPQSIEDLFDVLEKRRTAENNALKRLSFKKSSGLDSVVVSRLKRVVDEVEWDGVMVWPYAREKVNHKSSRHCDDDCDELDYSSS